MAACAAIGVAAPTTAEETSADADAPISITISATPIAVFNPRAPHRRRFGMVEYLGGLELTSSYRKFGGLSAIRVAADGEHFVSLTDRGRWLTGRIVYAHGQPAGIAEAVMAPMLGPDGRTLESSPTTTSISCSAPCCCSSGLWRIESRLAGPCQPTRPPLPPYEAPGRRRAVPAIHAWS